MMPTRLGIKELNHPNTLIHDEGNPVNKFVGKNLENI